MPWSRRNSMANDSSTRLGLKNEEDMRERSFEGDESDGELISCGSDGSDDDEEYIDFSHI